MLELPATALMFAGLLFLIRALVQRKRF